MGNAKYICIILRITRNYTVHIITQRKQCNYYTTVVLAVFFADNEINPLNSLASK